MVTPACRTYPILYDLAVFVGFRPMTYCVGVLLNDGVVFASDSRTNAGVDNFASFCKMTVFERPGDRAIVLLSSGNLAGTQAVISMLKQRGDAKNRARQNIWTGTAICDGRG